MTGPGPGWYTDPSDPGQVRWWSGESWTEHAAPNPQYSRAPEAAAIEYPGAPYVPMANAYASSTILNGGKLTRREKDRQTRRNNSLAYTGCVLSLVAFLINPFAILSIL